RWTDVMNGSNTRFFYVAFKGEVKVRRINSDKNGGRLSDKMIAQKAAYLEQFGEAFKRFDQPHYRQTILREKRVETQCQHTWSTNAGKLCIGKALAQGCH